MVRSRTLEHRRYECPYPDCDGYLKMEVDNNRGMTVYFNHCEKCERNPRDFDEGVQ